MAGRFKKIGVLIRHYWSQIPKCLFSGIETTQQKAIDTEEKHDPDLQNGDNDDVFGQPCHGKVKVVVHLRGHGDSRLEESDVPDDGKNDIEQIVHLDENARSFRARLARGNWSF